MRRKTDWRARLVRFMGTNARAPYEEGVWDCALFAAGAIRAMTGHDPARKWRGYRSIAEGMAQLRKAGFEDHIALAAKLLKEVKTPDGAAWPAGAQEGDLAVVPVADGDAFGIVQGAGIYVLGPRGVMTIPLRRATRAFRI